MAVAINTYSGILGGVLSWLGRDAGGETIITNRFDDILAMCERRMYYGFATEDVGNPLRSDPLRIPEMEITVRTADVAAGDTTIAQPSDFLELISVYNSTLNAPMNIVSQRVIDGFGSRSVGSTKLIAVSGTNFRLLDAAPASLSLTMHYYRKLTTPSGSTVNDILTKYPDVYLYGCMIEACIRTQDRAGSLDYLAMYNASVAGLNARTQRITASTVPVMRLRVGRTP
jgi:hypothetical protein